MHQESPSWTCSTLRYRILQQKQVPHNLPFPHFIRYFGRQ